MLRVVQGDVLDSHAVLAAARPCRVAINCTSPAGGDATVDLAKSVITHGTAAGIEAFYMVGGLGALWVPGTNRSVLVQDWDDAEAMERHGLSPQMPRERIRSMTKGHLAAMAYLERAGVDHAFLCPGRMIDRPPDPGRVVFLDELGGTASSTVTFADVARVIVDDLGRGALIGHRVCVSR